MIIETEFGMNEEVLFQDEDRMNTPIKARICGVVVKNDCIEYFLDKNTSVSIKSEHLSHIEHDYIKELYGNTPPPDIDYKNVKEGN